MEIDRIVASQPIDEVAARVVSSKAYPEYDASNRKIWESCPQLKPISLKMLLHSNFVNYTGYKFGRLEVVGYYGGTGNGKGSQWVVKCSCGRFELRRSKKIQKDTSPKCFYCDKEYFNEITKLKNARGKRLKKERMGWLA